MDSDSYRETDVLKIGRVITVEGRVVKVQVDKTKNVSHLMHMGKPLRNVSVGSYVKITKGFQRLIGKIEGEYTYEDNFIQKKEYRDERDRIKRSLQISLLGFYERGQFKRGIRELPLIGDECFILDEQEFVEIHNFVAQDDEPILLGHLSSEKGMPLQVGVNSLFASHVGIFGNTGSGKSYTLAKLYCQLFLKYGSSQNFLQRTKFFLIDFNGEYINSNKRDSDNTIVDMKYKSTYCLSTRDGGSDRYPVATDMLHDPLFWTILLEATEKTQAPFIRRSISNKFLDEKISDDASLKDCIIDTIVKITTYKDKTLERGLVLNFLHDLRDALEGHAHGFQDAINYFDQNLKFHNLHNEFYLNDTNQAIYANQPQWNQKISDALQNTTFSVVRADGLTKVRIKILLNYYNEIVRGYSNKEHISPLVKRLEWRFHDLNKVLKFSDDATGPQYSSKNFTIVSLRDVNIHMRKILPLLFCKQLYEKKKEDGKNDTYLNLIVDEAHNILSSSSQRESEQWKDYRLETFEEIIKEGRKFGVFLTIASQRPFDISPTIISQLHNYILHRLINNNDIQAIEKTVSYLDKVSFDSLPILPTGTCVLAGLVAQIPVIIEVDPISDENKPFNQTIAPTKHW